MWNAQIIKSHYKPEILHNCKLCTYTEYTMLFLKEQLI